MKVKFHINILGLFMTMVLLTSAHSEQLHKFGDISGEYIMSGIHYCSFDNGEKFTRGYKDKKFIIAYTETATSDDGTFYDIYYIFDENEVFTGYLYVGPNKRSVKAYYMDFGIDKEAGESGYLMLKKKNGKIKIKKAVHSTVFDGWRKKREYSCKVIRRGIMTEKIPYRFNEIASKSRNMSLPNHREPLPIKRNYTRSVTWTSFTSF